MESGSVLVLSALVSAFICAVLACRIAFGIAQTRVRSQRVRTRSGSGGFLRGIVRNGVRGAAPLSSRVLRVRRVEVWCADACAVLQSRGWACTAESVCSIMCAGVCAIGAVGTMFRSGVLGLAAAACLVIVANALVARETERRSEDIREALPDVLRAMGVCFHAGFTLQQTFEQLERETSGATARLFAQSGHAMRTGTAARTALEDLRGASHVPELAFVSVALTVQHQTGGSMQHVLDATCESLTSELELRRSLRVHTAQARLSARVVTGVSVALVAVLSLLSKDFLGPFFQSVLGFVMLCMAVTMQVAGVLIVRRMLRVEVD